MALTKNTAFFSGADSDGLRGLWLTDGTVGGTTEIGGLGDAGVVGVGQSGLHPSRILTVFHTAYTEAADGNFFALWISDGTAAGTVEVGGRNSAGISGANASFAPDDFVWYRGKVVFSAKDTAGGVGLWITDGTAAGTTEIGGLKDQAVNNASSLGLGPTNTVAFNGKIYFYGTDSSNFDNLWATDGTAAGTTEIGRGKIAGASVTGLEPSNLVVASGRLFFTGFDASNDIGLWVTDGTAAGTTEVGGLGDQAVEGADAFGLRPLSTIQLNGNVVFGGNDKSGGFGLWVSDGTAAGTVELGGPKNQGIAGAGANGLAPDNFVRLGNRLLFDGRDANGNATLWVTDGTVVGTTEIGGLNNHGVVGTRSSGLQPSSPAVLGGKVLFNGFDSNGHLELWVTDGTAAGTTEIGGLQGVPGAGTSLSPIAIGTPFTVTGTSDFNGDFYSDVLWRSSSGGLADWSMNANAIGSSTPTFNGVAVTPDASFSVVGISDFNGDGQADVLWRNSTTGETIVWQMNGSAITSSADTTLNAVAVKPDASFSVAGVGDFNGDSNADILWRSSVTGEIALWEMNGSAIIGSADVTSDGVAVRPDASFSIAGIGDFDGDGRKDVLWRNGTTGETIVWQMNGSLIASSADTVSNGVAVKPDSSFSVAGVGDFNGDGNADILWRSTSGEVAVWLMNGNAIIGSADVTFDGVVQRPDATWHVIDIGDFNGDGSSDVLWRSDNGVLAEWLMNGTTISQALTPTFNGASVSPDATFTRQARPTNFG